MAQLGKLGLASALCLIMSLSLATSGAFAQSTNQGTAGSSAQITAAHTPQGVSNALLLKNSRGHVNSWNVPCGAACGGGFGYFHRRLLRVTRITTITRIIHITKIVRFERFHYRGGHEDWAGSRAL